MTLFFRFLPSKPPGVSVSFLVLSLLAGSPIGVQTSAQAAEDLKQAIATQKSQVAKTRADRDQVRAALNTVQSNLASAQKEIDHLQAKILETDQDLNRLLQQQSALNTRKTALHHQIDQGLQAAYRLGGTAAISTLLARSDALATERDLHYLRDLLRPTLQDIETLKQTQQSLTENRQQLDRSRADLRRNQDQLDAQLTNWQQQKAEQAKLLSQLGEKLENQSQQLQQLLAKKKALDAEVAAANKRAHAHKQTQPQAEDRETSTDHHRHIPVNGRIVRSYGADLGLGNLRSQGIVFSSPLDQPVRAVAGGRVVYADHLKGWGNLVILRHRHNYLSLYAHNSRLDVHAGEAVHRGQILGVTGQIDAHQTGVYFEVRHGNDTINPAHWGPWRSVHSGH